MSSRHPWRSADSMWLVPSCLPHREVTHLPTLGRRIKQSMKSTLGCLQEPSLVTHVQARYIVFKYPLSSKNGTAPWGRTIWKLRVITAQAVPSLTEGSHRQVKNRDWLCWPSTGHQTRQGLGSIQAACSGASGDGAGDRSGHKAIYRMGAGRWDESRQIIKAVIGVRTPTLPSRSSLISKTAWR